MCPMESTLPIAIQFFTEEMLVQLMEDIEQGKPLPGDLLSDLNPYSYMPSNLPDGIGYFSKSDFKKDTQFGSWKVKEESYEIFINSVITGWRTTLEFFEGQSPNEKKTDWVMQEYRINSKEMCNNSKAKEYGSLCRLFQSVEHLPDYVMDLKCDNDLPESKNTTGQGSKNEPKKNGDVEAESLTAVDGWNCVVRGDYLELDDLVDPLSQSSSSFNSSCPTLASDEWFDSDALLQGIEDSLTDQNKKFKYIVSGTVTPTKVVMRPPITGKLSTEDVTKSVWENDKLELESRQETGAVSILENASASAAVNEKEKKKKKKRCHWANEEVEEEILLPYAILNLFLSGSKKKIKKFFILFLKF